MKTKEYWDKDFETRYENLQKDPKRPPLKVTRVTPHVADNLYNLMIQLALINSIFTLSSVI